MTKKQAEKELERIRKEKCNCGSEDLEILHHKSGCTYRVKVFCNPKLRPFVGQLYSAA